MMGFDIGMLEMPVDCGTTPAANDLIAVRIMGKDKLCETVRWVERTRV